MRLAAALVLFLATPAIALEPKDVIVVANRSMPESREVAEHYLAKRGVPKANLILLDLPKIEDISRDDYDKKLAGPLREALKDRKDAAKVILTVYGVPLRVGAKPPSAEEKNELAKLAPQLEAARKKVAELEKNKSANSKDLTAARGERDTLDARRRRLSHAQSQASVDSELMLLWWGDYPLDRWVMNPLYFRINDATRKAYPPVVQTCRLDGPTPEIAKRLVDDAVAVEAKGLTGRVVIDARGIGYNAKKDGPTGYGAYDESMRETAQLFEKSDLPVTLDSKGPVLAAGAAKGVALYCGWYSHANFVDCCEYVPGAVAWHLASSEAVTLRRPDTKVWCPNLLRRGVAATVGPVAEPYTVGFPKPAEFFGLLGTGQHTLVESYSRSILLTSWMTVLIGDPLYNPFGKNPKLKNEDVVPSPRGSRKANP